MVRSKAKYQTSLNVIEHIAKTGHNAKSGIMVGIGETKEEVLKTLDDLVAVGCKYITIGQYLQPRNGNLKVERYVEPAEFLFYREEALKKGFLFAESGPLVRSSYHAEQAHLNGQSNG